MLPPQEALDLYPLMKIDDLIGAAFIPADSQIGPNSLTQAHARGIRKYGGIIKGIMIKDLVCDGRHITHVATDRGTIAADFVVNVAGLWARQVGWMTGVGIPASVCIINILHRKPAASP